MKNADRDIFRFDRFSLDPHDRRLLRDGAPVELNGRYLDALALLVAEPGRLITKTRFHDEVWRGVPVTDEALTQCIKTLRRQLGDDAARPRFIETAPKHGYRFIAPVERVAADGARQPAGLADAGPVIAADLVGLAGAGLVGGALAGLLGGVFYGLAAAGGGAGALSVLLVLVVLTVGLGAVAGTGVGLGIATARLATGPAWAIATLGGALGGMVTGAVVKLVGTDGLGLLFGRSPNDMTGALEGVVLGAAIGFGAWLAGRTARPSLRRSIALAALIGLVAGVIIDLLGGRLMAGSLDRLAQQFPESRLRLDAVGGLFGETGFGPVSHLVITGLEAALFTACVVATIRTMAVTPAARSPSP